MKKFISILTVVTVLLLASCRKEDSTIFVPDPGYQLDSAWVNTISDQSKISELVKSIIPVPPPVDSAEILFKDTTIIRRELFDIIIPPLTLKSASGGDVLGKVNFDFLLLQKKGDFIRLQQSTINNDKYLLNSGGGFYIRFFRGTEELGLFPGKNIIVRYNEPVPLSNMKVFYGSDVMVGPAPVNVSNGWALATNNNYVKPVPRKFNNTASYAYEVSTDRLKWVNAAMGFPQGVTLMNVSAYVPDLFSNANTQAFIVFKDTRTVVKLTGDAGARKFIAPNIPADKAALIVTVSKIAQDYFLGTQEIITSDKPVEVKPVKGGLDRIIGYLNSL